MTADLAVELFSTEEFGCCVPVDWFNCKKEPVRETDEKFVKIFVGKPDGKRPLGKSRRRWKVNIKTVPREIGRDNVDCIHVTSDSVQCWERNLRILQKTRNFLTS